MQLLYFFHINYVSLFSNAFIIKNLAGEGFRIFWFQMLLLSIIASYLKNRCLRTQQIDVWNSVKCLNGTFYKNLKDF